jgi:hypothetical protein
MPTDIAVTFRNSKTLDVKVPSNKFTDDFFAVAIFSGVGLLVSLVAIVCGQQGLWF